MTVHVTQPDRLMGGSMSLQMSGSVPPHSDALNVFPAAVFLHYVTSHTFPAFTRNISHLLIFFNLKGVKCINIVSLSVLIQVETR